MMETEIVWTGQSHSAFSSHGGISLHFCGEECYSHGGRSFLFLFKLVCPNCGAEGEQLEHMNWGMDDSTEIRCRKCLLICECDDDRDYESWKVGR